MLRTVLGLPLRWWARQSLRARLTLLATALFSFAVVTGAVLVIVLQRYALVRVLDASAAKTARDIATQFASGKRPQTVTPTTTGIAFVQVVDTNDGVIATSVGADRASSVLTPEQLETARHLPNRANRIVSARDIEHGRNRFYSLLQFSDGISFCILQF